MNFRSLLFFLSVFLITTSCSTNYYTVLLNEDAKMYNSSDSASVITTIPKGSQVYLSSQPDKRNYKRIKWKEYSGWAYNPSYTKYSNYTETSYPTSTYSSYRSNSSSSSGGSVHVKGYTRKNGTYVKPHTRSSPSRRR